MILCVSLNPAVDKMLKINSINIGRVNRANVESIHAGGKAINVAYDLLIQGEKAMVTGFVGGRTGMLITEDLKNRNIAYEFIGLATETRTNMNYIDERGRVTEILEAGHLVDAESERKFITLYKKLLTQTDLAVLSGSLPIGLDDQMYGVLIEAANKAGVPVALDTSGEALRHGVQKAPFIIKPNLSELENLTHRKYDLSVLDEGIEEFFESSAFKNVLLPDLCELKNLNIALICVTFGEKGLLIFTKNTIVICKAPKVDVVNTVGSGDCVLSAIIHSMSKQADLIDTAKYATAVSAAHVTTMNVGDMDVKLVSKLIDEIEYGVYTIND